MAEAEADIGFGTIVDLSQDDGATWSSGGQVAGNITPPTNEIDIVNATHMTSPNGDKEYILGLNDPGECSYPVHFIPSSATDTLYRAIKAARLKVKVRITWKNGVKWTFSGLLTGYKPNAPIEDRMLADVTWKVSGSTVVV